MPLAKTRLSPSEATVEGSQVLYSLVSGKNWSSRLSMSTLRRPSMAQCRTRSLEEVMKAVIMEDIPLDYGPWLSMSPEGLHFLQRLLQRDPAQRASALEALEHPWFARHFGGGGGQQQEESDQAPASGMTLPRSRNNIVPLDVGGSGGGAAAPRCCFYSSAAASVLRTRSGV